MAANTSYINGTVPLPDMPPTALIGAQLHEWLDNGFHYLILLFGSLGVVTNAINIRVFIRQGVLSDSNPLGLFSLALADFAGCLLEIPVAMCRLIRYSVAVPTYVTCELYTRVSCEIFHVVMSRITCWVTVYIAVERCLCVLIPFKIKLLLVPRTTGLVMVMIFSVIIGIYVPLLSNVKVGWRSGGNETQLVIKDNATMRKWIDIISLLFNTISSIMAFIIITLATGLLLYKLYASRKFRQASSSQSDSKTGYSIDTSKKESSRKKNDLEVLKTVTMVTVLFLVCLSMSHIPGLVMLLLPEVQPTGVNRNLFQLVYYYKITFDLINSSLNYFFYIRFSSRYKKAFNQVFRKYKN